MVILKLLPNPYVHLDVKGRCAGTHPIRPDENAQIGGCTKIGARVDRLRTTTKPNPLARGGAVKITPIIQETVWEYDYEPVVVERSPDGYYDRACHDGSLIAADAETAALVSIPFVEPAKVLAKERAKALARWQREHGKDSVPAFMSDPCPVAEGKALAKKRAAEAAEKEAKEASEKDAPTEGTEEVAS